MKIFITVLLLLTSSIAFSYQILPEDQVVGRYKLHFNQQGELIDPDEFYIFHGVNDDADGFTESARKQFQRAASYGNTFGFYFAGLLYLQQEQNIKGYAWLSLVERKSFPYAENVKNLLTKLEAGFDKNTFQQAKDYIVALELVYGVEATFERRLKWSKNFRLTGTRIKGRIPSNLVIQTDLSSGGGAIGKMSANINSGRIKAALKTFVYDYEMDFRITEGVVNIQDIELIDGSSKKN